MNFVKISRKIVKTCLKQRKFQKDFKIYRIKFLQNKKYLRKICCKFEKVFQRNFEAFFDRIENI